LACCCRRIFAELRGSLTQLAPSLFAPPLLSRRRLLRLRLCLCLCSSRRDLHAGKGVEARRLELFGQATLPQECLPFGCEGCRTQRGRDSISGSRVPCFPQQLVGLLGQLLERPSLA